MKTRMISAVLAAVACIFTLCSCEYIFGSVADEGAVTVVIENADGSFAVYEAELKDVENKSEGAKGILEQLCKTDGLQLEITESTYGAYVCAVGSIKESVSEGLYVIVYTSVEADSYAGAPTLDYNGTVMYQSGVGLSTMNVEAGTTVLFRLEKSPY